MSAVLGFMALFVISLLLVVGWACWQLSDGIDAFEAAFGRDDDEDSGFLGGGPKL